MIPHLHFDMLQSDSSLLQIPLEGSPPGHPWPSSSSPTTLSDKLLQSLSLEQCSHIPCANLCNVFGIEDLTLWRMYFLAAFSHSCHISCRKNVFSSLLVYCVLFAHCSCSF